MDKASTIAKIRRLKLLPFGETRIDGTLDGMPYRLLLLTADREDDDRIIGLLARWRDENQKYFPAVFKVTVEGTRTWYRDKLIGEPDRLLFMIEAEGEFFGHVGLYRFRFDEDTCDIDNIVRGIQGHPGILSSATAEMMRWGAQELGIARYSLDTSTDCERAVHMYKRVGFVEKRRDPVIQVRDGSRLEWIFPEPGKKYDILDTRDNIYMECDYAET